MAQEERKSTLGIKVVALLLFIQLIQWGFIIHVLTKIYN